MKDQYAWVPWFRLLVEKIAEGGEKDLVDRAKRVNWKGENPKNPDVKPALLNYGDENIDPFSFLYFLAQKNTRHQLVPVYKSVSKEFGIDYQHLPYEGIDRDLLSDESIEYGCIFPVPTGATPALFHWDGEGNPSLLWKVFRRIVSGDGEITQKEFEDMLAIKSVRVQKLTQCLFLIDPKRFMPADKTTIRFHNALDLSSFNDEEKEIMGSDGFNFYKDMLIKFKSVFPSCHLYEINTALYKMGRWRDENIGLGKKFFQVSTNIYDNGDDHWNKFFKGNCVRTGGKASGVRFDDLTIPDNPYPLTEPSTGDIILVRYKQKREYAIGIVYVNGYVDNGLKKDSAIHVLWINKNIANLKLYMLPGFSTVKLNQKLCGIFSNAPEYRPTFDFIKSVRRLPPVIGKPMQHNQILYGPPGTGKTWHTTNYALDIIDDGATDDKERFDELKQAGRIDMVTFHQSFTYEDFVEGIRPVIDQDSLKYKIVDGVFKRISMLAENDPEQKYVLIIDEINRGNIAKIFGELITLIESTKRLGNSDEVTVTLPYSGDQFGIPKNLYLIGTMNTADRSIALLDTALRRRFDFIEMMPELTLVNKDVAGINCRQLLKVMNHRITALLDRDHQLGHSYFMDICDLSELASTFKNQIIPQLKEYFYDDWEKIDIILNRNSFVTVTDTSEELSMEKNHKTYELISVDNPKWSQPENYQQIYSSSASQQPDKDGG